MKIAFNRNSQKALSIQKYASSQNKNSLIRNLSNKIAKIEQEISQARSELLEVQMAGIKAKLSNDKNWIQRLEKKFYWSQIKESSCAHRDRLIFLRQEKRRLQIELDKLNGQYWIKKIKTWLIFLLISMIILLAFWVILLGLIASLYSLPVWGSILLIYFLIQHRSRNHLS